MQYVNRAHLILNGAEILDIRKIEEDEIEYNRPVKLMFTTGFAEVTQRFGGTLDYAIPFNQEINWAAITGATLSIERDDNTRVTYSGVFITKKGKVSYQDGEDTIYTVEYGATDRTPE